MLEFDDRLDRISLRADGRLALIATTGSASNLELRHSRLILADLELRRSWHFDLRGVDVHWSGFDARGPFFIGSTRRRRLGLARRVAGIVVAPGTPCEPPSARLYRLAGGTWAIEREVEGDCSGERAPVHELMFATRAEEVDVDWVGVGYASLLSPELDSDLQSRKAGDWILRQDVDGGGLAIFDGHDETYFLPIAPGGRVRADASIARASGRLWGEPERHGKWLLVVTAPDSGYGWMSAIVFDTDSGQQTFFRDDIWHPQLWIRK